MGRKKKKAMLTADGYSVHTIEVKIPLAKTKWDAAVKSAFDVAKKTHTRMYALGLKAYCCLSAKKHGVRLYYTALDRKGNTQPYVKAIINPRKLLDANSSYLGTMPVDEKSLEQFSHRFTDVMRKLDLPEFFEDWKLSRVDLCVNLVCPQSKIARELIRTARKWPTPPKYKREHVSKKNVIQFSADAITITLYDKTYQILNEALLVENEKLPNGILRIEVRYGREYIRRAGKNFSANSDSLKTLEELVHHSKPLMLKYIEKCFPVEDFYAPDAQIEKIEASDIPPELQTRMVNLVQALRKRRTLDHAIKALGWGQKERKEVLRAFSKIGVSPIPLRKGFYRDQLLSIPHILRQIEADCATSVEVKPSSIIF